MNTPVTIERIIDADIQSYTAFLEQEEFEMRRTPVSGEAKQRRRVDATRKVLEAMKELEKELSSE